MALSGIEDVLKFLRKNGLSEAESALMEDVIEKSELASVDFNKFIFPMVPPPPILKILPNRIPRRSDDCSSVSSDDFVSLDSSSSDFINPYGDRQTTGGSSESSSEHLSEFGTARDYPDFDMQNSLWYEDIEEIKEAEEHYSMPPIFCSSDSISGPAEDKFVTTTTPENQIQSESAFTPIETDNFDKIHVENDEVHVTDYYLKTEETQNRTIVENRSNQSRSTKSSYRRNPVYEPMKQNDDEDDSTTNDELTRYTSNEDEHEVFNLRIIHRKNRTGFEANKDLEIIMNSVIAARYYVTEYLGSAAFSKVVQARDLFSGSDVCLKIIKNDKDFFDQSLDEIKLLKFVNKYDPADQRHILRLFDYFYFQEHLFIVCELLRANLYEFQKYNRESGGEPYFTLNRLQVITRQCLEALEYLHDLGIIHCDLKPENILIKSYRRCEVKVIDLGSSCFQTDNLCLYVQSRSYRAPEVILGLQYDEKIDIWSLGCILAELCTGEVLFPNDGIVMSLARITGFLGPIDMEMLVNGQETHKYFTKEYDLYHINEETNEMEYIIPAESSLEEQLEEAGGDMGFTDFVRHLLEINPKNRPTATTALLHPWLSHSYT